MDIQKNILVIEDEKVLRRNLEEQLTRNEFNVFAYSSAEEAIASDVVSLSDAIIMDIGLPGMNGWEATEIFKKNNEGIPVIMLTAYSEVNFRLQGFETGADDYIIKPFFMEELVARLKVVLKRYEMLPGGKRYYQIGDLMINTKGKTVQRNQIPLKLSVTEFNLLVLLAIGEGYPVSKEEIMKRIWNGKLSVSENTIEVYINLLRNKIDKNFSRKLIHTKVGYGYYLAEN